MKTFRNKKAEYNYYIQQQIEAGLMLQGTEIKSVRAGKINFKDSYARIEQGEVWLYNLHISVYDKGSYNNHDPERPRKLLLNRREINKLQTKLDEQGYTLVPLELVINDQGLAKIILALAKGKKKYDKRESLQEKDRKRDQDRVLKSR
ncbi:MAG: SsrA-binding protein SmpB [Candidatus Cloacimonetes bacterium]|nr:SsrA-binding protein SmpB [Candidatus Cloacimonadota bacterium]